MEAPSLLHLSSDNSSQIQDSACPTLQKAVTVLVVEIQIYFLTSQAEFMGIQNALIDSQVDSRNQM